MTDDNASSDPWLTKARNAFEMSTTYVDANYRKQWENNIRMFQSRHASDSKYNSDAYKYRSKIFRPKTRSAIRKNEAAGVAAFFSSMDSTYINAVNENDPEQMAAAEIMRELIKHRLSVSIPWFLVCIGALQEAQKIGTVCSYNYWKYKEKRTKRKVPATDPETGATFQDPMTGEPLMQDVEDVKVIEDEPCIELFPIEQVRFHPGADWLDPVNSSPFFIRMFPMYVYEVKARMKRPDPKTNQPKWFSFSDGEIGQARTEFDSTRMERDKNREDKHTQHVSAVSEYDTVWVHENFMRDENGEDHVYYTLGTQFRLSDPVPREEVYFHDARPVTLGCFILEAFENMPSGIPELGEGLQKEANEIVNSRLDNVKLVLNKRYFVKRGAQVDLKSIVRNAAGSVTMTTDPDKDVKAMEFNDVTSSSYAEQDRINVDHDELVGNFSAGSVQSNRSLNETVGGLSMLNTSAGQMSDYGLKTFSETWMEPTLRQLVKLEQAYETDETIIQLAADKAQAWKKYGVDRVTDELLNKDLLLTVDVGVGASNPVFRMERFLMGVRTAAEIASTQAPGLKTAEIIAELFSYLGYKSGARFFEQEQQEDPRLAQAMQMIQELQAALESKAVEKEAEMQGKTAQKQLEVEGKLEAEAMKQEGENQRHQEKMELDMFKTLMQQQEASQNRQQSSWQTMVQHASKQAQGANNGG